MGGFLPDSGNKPSIPRRASLPTPYVPLYSRRVSSLTSAAVPAVGPDDHVRGDGREAIVYLDLACPHCAATWVRIAPLALRLVFRHFPVASKHPRAPALHAAVEAVALQGGEEAVWALIESIYRDQGRVDDPHLWEWARGRGLDLERFDRDRRSDAVGERVRGDFQGGIRAGVTATPAIFVDGREAGEDDLSALAL
jgi:protein-disulfide isomerase